jgi:hypothetical protein
MAVDLYDMKEAAFVAALPMSPWVGLGIIEAYRLARSSDMHATSRRSILLLVGLSLSYGCHTLAGVVTDGVLASGGESGGGSGVGFRWFSPGVVNPANLG